MKPGVKTSEFWVMLIVNLVALLAPVVVAKLDAAGTQAATVAAALVVALNSGLYHYSRGMAKGGAQGQELSALLAGVLGREATRQPGNEATRQPGNEATRQRGNEATRQRGTNDMDEDGDGNLVPTTKPPGGGDPFAGNVVAGGNGVGGNGVRMCNHQAAGTGGDHAADRGY